MENLSAAEVYLNRNGILDNVIVVSSPNLDLDFPSFNLMNYIGQPRDQELILFREPLRLNAEWVQMVEREGEAISVITSMDRRITVPYGEFSTIEVTTFNTDGSAMKYYYAKGIGMIRFDWVQTWTRTDHDTGELLETEHTDVIVELVAIEKGPFRMHFPVFHYVNGEYDMIYAYVDIYTNADIDKLFSDALREAYNGIEGGDIRISGETVFKLTTWDAERRLVTVNMSASFKDDMQNAACGEALAFQALVDTIAYFNYHPSVRITLDGVAYRPDGVFFDENGHARFIGPEEDDYYEDENYHHDYYGEYE
jgi:hypothetical protein